MAEDQKTSAKWASEAFEVIRLFQRFGSRLPGLLALEVGWALLLVLIANLSPSGSAPVLSLPALPMFRLPTPRQMLLTTLFTIGAIAIVIVWSLASGLYLYLWIPLKRLARQGAILMLHAAFLAFALLQLPVRGVLVVVERRKRTNWEKLQTPEKLEELRKEHGSAYNVYVRAAMRFSADALIDVSARAYSRTLANLASAGYIGLSPFYSYSFEEDQKAAKAPLQVFAAAIGRLRLRLGRLRATRFFHFVVLPAAPRVETNQTASRLRRWFGLDALLWGSYISVDPPRVWLNVERHFGVAANGHERSSRQEFHPLDVRLGDDVSMVLDQNDPLDTYIALLLALLDALEAHRRPRLRLYPQYSDALVLAWGERHTIMSELIRDVLFVLDSPPPRRSFHRGAKEVLIARASDWAAERLTDSWDAKPSARLLKEVVARCAALEPDRAEHYYRLGAAQCLLDHEADARASFVAGQERDTLIRRLDPAWPELSGVLAVDLSDLHLASSDDERAAARAASYVARLLALGRAEIRKDILEDLDAESIRTAHRIRTETGQLSAGERILYSLVGLP